MQNIKYQMNLTLLDNTVLKAYESIEIKNDSLILKFLKSDVTMKRLRTVFSDTTTENYKTIYKTTIAGKQVCKFEDYIKLISITESIENIPVEVTKEIATNIENETENTTLESTTIIYETVDTPINMIIVKLGYISPMEQKLNKVVEKVIPNIDVDTCTLEELQNYKQTQNKLALADFLATHPLLWTDEEYYGVKQEDQMEMALDLSAYQIKVTLDPEWKLEWHNIKKSCREFTVQEYNALMGAIIDYVYPYRRLQESYKESIYNATTKDEVLAIELKYEVQ